MCKLSIGLMSMQGRLIVSLNPAGPKMSAAACNLGPPPSPLLTFIIPVRHQKNARDWNESKNRLAQTIHSISRQTDPNWQAIIVANTGAELPELPAGISVERVTFAPNLIHERQRGKTVEQFLDAFRLDKGKRVLAGMLASRTSKYFMIVDDDDFISNRVVAHVASQPMAHGWKIESGYIWDSGGRLLLQTNEFNRLCGTSLIIRSDLYGLPEDADGASTQWIMDMLGSHRRIAQLLAEAGTPLAILPFRGAVYRVASKGSHSGTPSFRVKYRLNRSGVRHPLNLLRNLARLRITGKWSRKTFGMP